MYRQTLAHYTVVPALLVLFALACGSSAAEPIPLFDGKSLANWHVEPGKTVAEHWQVKDGMILAENADQKGSNLWTKRKFRDFELNLEYRALCDDYDSGVFLRGPSHQVQIGVSRSLKIDLTGCIYAPQDKRGKYPGKSNKVTELHELGKWNHLRIVVTGKRIQTFLNQQPLVDYTAVVIPDEGPIGLQLHAGVHIKMLFRNLQIRPLVEP